ncbi:MAG: serpin family protein [Bacteroidaceae bacterium]|nr:serpin family protein [Bacteroidaceae bacterium]
MKYFIVFLMAFMPMLANAQKVRGDFDGDGVVTVNDITILIKAYLDEGSGYQSQGELEIPEVQDGKLRLTAEQRQYVTGANAFSFNLFRAVAGETDAGESMILSPLSVIYALGLVNNGASATVSKEISTVLGFGAAGTKDINAFCANLIANAPLLDENVTLGIANAFFLNSMKGYTLYDAFQTDMQNYYKAMVEELDFSEQASCDRINAWASEQTHGMIPSVLKKLSPEAVSYVLNALYFKGTWTYQFDPEYTWKDTFTKADKSTATVLMMNALIDSIPYMATDSYSAIRLPYGNGAYSMTLVLPHNGKTLADVEGVLAADSFQLLQNAMTEEQVEVHLPKFETEAGMPLVKIMKALGMPSAFAGAAFPYICPEQDEICISNIFQNAKIKVNEEGSEAAAVTVIEMVESMAPGEPTFKVFYANHPFLYFITERSTGTIFFMGRYMGDSVSNGK